MTAVSAIKCKKCGCTIFSRAVHDFRWCPCKTVAVDGGFDYLKIIGEPDDYIIVGINVKQTPKELYDDWNFGKKEYGIIQPTKIKKG